MPEESCPPNFCVDTMASGKVVGQCRYSEELKADVVAECDALGASVAKVAMVRGINANVVHRWRRLERKGPLGTVANAKPREFVAVAIAPQVPAQGQTDRDIEVELRRGAVTMKVVWPVSVAADFAAWTRELLR